MQHCALPIAEFAVPMTPAQPARRRLLKLGAAATVAFTLYGASRIWISHPIAASGHLSPAAQTIFRAVAASVLDGSLLPAGPERAAQLDAHIGRLESTLANFPPTTRTELATLLSLLEHAPTRYAISTLTQPWAEASPKETSAALENMRKSSIALRQQTYHALRDLTNAAFYADPTAWPLMGYPGPTAI